MAEFSLAASASIFAFASSASSRRCEQQQRHQQRRAGLPHEPALRPFQGAMNDEKTIFCKSRRKKEEEKKKNVDFCVFVLFFTLFFFFSFQPVSYFRALLLSLSLFLSLDSNKT